MPKMPGIDLHRGSIMHDRCGPPTDIKKPPKKWICYLCQRKFDNEKLLIQHKEYSDLHKKNLARKAQKAEEKLLEQSKSADALTQKDGNPPNTKVKNFFNKVGTSIEIKNEKLSNNFWAISGTMAAFYETLKNLSDWLVKKKTNRKKAQEYTTSLYFALAGLALENSDKNMKKFVSDSQTPGGLNWKGVNQLKKPGTFNLLQG